MTVYVDPLMDHGWILRGEQVRSCHMFTDSTDLEELHRMARRIGCKRTWFQDKRLPHYDLTMLRRQEAIGCGAVAVTRREAVELWTARAEAVSARVAAAEAFRCQTCASDDYCARIQCCAKRA